MCGGPLPSADEDAVNEHFNMFHPAECFASREDFEDQGASIQEVSSKSRWESSDESDSEVSDSEDNFNCDETAKDERDVNMNKTVGNHNDDNTEIDTICNKSEAEKTDNNGDNLIQGVTGDKSGSVTSDSVETETPESSTNKNKDTELAQIEEKSNHLGSVEEQVIPRKEKRKVNFNVTFGDIRKRGHNLIILPPSLEAEGRAGKFQAPLGHCSDILNISISAFRRTHTDTIPLKRI